MIIFLPQEKQGLAGLENTLTDETIRQWLVRLSDTAESEVMIRLPKFKMTCAFELSKILGAMGMPSAFSDLSADFSGMTGARDLFISRVIHQAFVDVNEEGTEAAAATVVAVELTAVSEPWVFQADHPFLFLIRDNPTGSILFLGRVVDPTQPTGN